MAIPRLTQETCNEVVSKYPYLLGHIPDYFKTQEMHNEAVRRKLYALRTNHLKTREMCDKAVRDDSSSLQFVPDLFVTQQQVESWCDECEYYDDDDDDDDDDNIIEWYDGYKKRKKQKAKIEEQFMSIAWHPSRWWDQCVPEDEKKETEKLWR